MAETPDHYYRALVGEEFTGTYKGIYNLEDDTSRIWYKIKYKDISEQFSKTIEDIEDKFEGRIWKGIHKGIIYVDSEYHGDCENAVSQSYKITRYKKFDFEINCKTESKYSDKCGYQLFIEKK